VLPGAAHAERLDDEVDELPEWAKPRRPRARPAVWAAATVVGLVGLSLWPRTPTDTGSAERTPDVASGHPSEPGTLAPAPVTPVTLAEPVKTWASAPPSDTASDAQTMTAAPEYLSAELPRRPAPRSVAPRTKSVKPTEVLVPILPVEVPP